MHGEHGGPAHAKVQVQHTEAQSGRTQPVSQQEDAKSNRHGHAAQHESALDAVLRGSSGVAPLDMIFTSGVSKPPLGAIRASSIVLPLALPTAARFLSMYEADGGPMAGTILRGGLGRFGPWGKKSSSCRLTGLARLALTHNKIIYPGYANEILLPPLHAYVEQAVGALFFLCWVRKSVSLKEAK